MLAGYIPIQRRVIAQMELNGDVRMFSTEGKRSPGHRSRQRASELHENGFNPKSRGSPAMLVDAAIDIRFICACNGKNNIN